VKSITQIRSLPHLLSPLSSSPALEPFNPEGWEAQSGIGLILYPLIFQKAATLSPELPFVSTGASLRR